MKKVYYLGWPCSSLLKVSLKAKLTFLLLIFSLLEIQANSYSQNTRISLNHDQVSMRELFSEIEYKSEYRFLYKNKEVDVDRKISINVKEEKIHPILNQVFKGTTVKYEIMDNRQIVLTQPVVVRMDNKEITPYRKVIQEIKIVGNITDTEENPLVGATVLEKGTTNGVVTDFDGNFSIDLKHEEAVLIVSYIGFATKEIPINGQSNISIVLEESAAGLDEVVVIGYGSKLEGELTGSISTVGEKIFDARPVTNTLNALQGAMPGVTVTRSSGQPGREGYSVQIRGASSIAGSSPLILIDGIPGDLNTLNPNDIKEISVLKDAAASIYGARAADGVVLVTTKSGKKGRLSASYSYNHGVKIPTYISEMTNTLELAEMYDEGMRNIGQPGVSQEVFDKIRNNADPEVGNGWMKYLENYPGFYGTHDWLEDIYRTGEQQSHNLTLSGGGDDHNYLFSAGYIGNKGVLNYGDAKSDLYNLRFNFGFNLFKDRLNVDIRSAFDNSVVVEPSALEEAIESAHLMWSYVPVHNSQSEFYWYQNYRNPAQLLQENGQRKSNLNKFQTNIKADLEVTEELKLVTQVGINLALTSSNLNNRTFGLINWEGKTFGSRNNPNSATYANSKNTYGSYTAYLDYNKFLSDSHRINLMGGISHEQNEYESQSITGYNFKSNDLFTLNLADRTDIAFMNFTGSLSDWALNSYFGRFSYAYTNTIFLDITTRVDGSSKFASSQRWSALFPAVSISWNLWEEDFVKSLNIFDVLKLRASWGQTGNQNLSFGNYDYIPLITLSGNYPLGSPNVGLPGAVASIASESRTWETVESTNVGVDFAFLKSRLNGTFDYFLKQNKDMLVSVTLPATLGGPAPTLNIGTLETKGWDFSLGWNDTKGDFKYSVSAIISDANNLLTKLEGNDTYTEGLVRTREGYPLNSYFGYESAGIIKNEEELVKYKQLGNIPQNIAIGDAKYRDLDGDGVISAFGKPEEGTYGDMKYLGDTNPRYTYSSNLSFSYKNFDFSMLLQGVGKKVGIREGVPSMPLYYVWHQSIRWFHGKTWTPERPDAEFPRIIPGGIGWDGLRDWNYRYSDRVVNQLSYMRVKSLILAFNFPQSICERMKMESVRIYASGEDLFTIGSGTWGNSYDPEAAFEGSLQAYQNYPFTKTISFGVDLKF